MSMEPTQAGLEEVQLGSDEIEEVVMSGKRVRKLTVKGQAVFEESNAKYINTLTKQANDIMQTFGKSDIHSCDKKEQLEGYIHDLEQCHGVFSVTSTEYVNYLQRVNTEESLQAEKDHELERTKITLFIDDTCELLKNRISNASEAHSVKSGKSRRSGQSQSSRHSSIATIIARKKAEAESAKVGLMFAKKEAEILKEEASICERMKTQLAVVDTKKAQFQADLHILKQEKEVAITEAEIKVLEEVYSEESSRSDFHSLPQESAKDRTERYVAEHGSHVKHERPDSIIGVNEVDNPNVNLCNAKSVTGHMISDHVIPCELNSGQVKNDHVEPRVAFSHVSAGNVNTGLMASGCKIPDNVNDQWKSNFSDRQRKPVHLITDHINACVNSSNDFEDTRLGLDQYGKGMQSLNPNASIFHPSQSQVSELTQFLLKKDLLLTRFSNFNDRPESYAMWKSNFLSVISELNVSAIEELDLLLKWLGPESRKSAHSLRSANIHDQGKGLTQVWNRMEERYGSPVMVEASLNKRIANFPKIGYKDHKRLYELSDLLSEIECTKSDPNYQAVLAYFDSSSGVNPIVNKLPNNIIDRWTNHAFRYKEKWSVPFPPFSEFVQFVCDISRLRNDPCFMYESHQQQLAPQRNHKPASVNTRKTDVSTSSEKPQWNSRNDGEFCPLHLNLRHTLNDCRTFKSKPFQERKDFLMRRGMCFKCCLARHLASECTEDCQCQECGSRRHATALHIEQGNEHSRNSGTSSGSNSNPKPQADKKVENSNKNSVASLSTKCTQVCNGSFQGRSCAKHILVRVYPKGQSERAVLMYASIDDQSNASLCKTTFFETFDIEGNTVPYTLSSCGGRVETLGRRADGFTIESMDGNQAFELPTLIECNDIPDHTDEIPTPEVALNHSHLQPIARCIPPVDTTATIQILIGRDLPEVHHVLDQITGPSKSPYAQRLPLGWVIVGEVCLGRIHPPSSVYVSKTHVLDNKRTSICEPCPNRLQLKDSCNFTRLPDIHDRIFTVTREDDMPGHSIEDTEFLDIMDKEMKLNSNGKWESPLPFKSPRPRLPNNKAQSYNRAKSLTRDLKKNKEKQVQFKDFMQKIFDNHHAEVVPPLKNRETESWYVPIFAVYHPRKPSSIRVVFDSASMCEGISLNSVLLRGPDLMNDLLGILLRFRREPVGIIADIQQMLFCFEVLEKDRDYLRFWWHADNDLDRELIEYRMNVHIFGNVSSPATATYGLRRAAHGGEQRHGSDTREFIERDFYVDDGVTSLRTEEEAIGLLKRTQSSLYENGKLRLHKITSNSAAVMNAFPNDDLAKDLKDLDLKHDLFPLQRSLGMTWNINTDMFTFRASGTEKPFTRRGVLSVINSIFDPMGLRLP